MYRLKNWKNTDDISRAECRHDGMKIYVRFVTPGVIVTLCRKYNRDM